MRAGFIAEFCFLYTLYYLQVSIFEYGTFSTYKIVKFSLLSTKDGLDIHPKQEVEIHSGCEQYLNVATYYICVV